MYVISSASVCVHILGLAIVPHNTTVSTTLQQWRRSSIRGKTAAPRSHYRPAEMSSTADEQQQRVPDSGGGGSGSGSGDPKSPDAPSRVIISESDLGSLSAGELVSRWRRQDTYVDTLEQRLTRQEGR